MGEQEGCELTSIHHTQPIDTKARQNSVSNNFFCCCKTCI